MRQQEGLPLQKNGLRHDHDEWEISHHCQWNDLWCKYEKQEYQGFSISYQSNLWHQHDQCKCQCSAKRGVFELLLNILTYYLAENTPWKSSEFSKFTWNFIQSTNKIHRIKEYPYNIHLKIFKNILTFQIFQERMNKVCAS